MFRSLRSVAMQLDQGLAEMEELDSLLEEEEEAPVYDGPAMSGPATVEAEPQVAHLDAGHARAHAALAGSRSWRGGVSVCRWHLLLTGGVGLEASSSFALAHSWCLNPQP